jgi:hypothetical protein
MPKRTDISTSLALGAALLLGGCAHDRWARMQAEFPEVSANCRVPGVELERDGRDGRLLRLVFSHRSNMRMRAEQDGRLACFQHWARERGYRLVASGPDGADR